MSDYSIEATIKGYEERLEAVQRALVQVKRDLEKCDSMSDDTPDHIEMSAAIIALNKQIGEVNDIVACLREDHTDKKGAIHETHENSRGCA